MLVVRMIKESDLERVILILNQLSPHHESVDLSVINDIFESIRLDDNYYVNVCEIDGLVVGTSQLFIQKNFSHGGRGKGHIENVVVDYSYRSKGIGKLLVDDLVSVAKIRGCYKIVLSTKTLNSHFYEQLGFKMTGEVEMSISL